MGARLTRVMVSPPIRATARQAMEATTRILIITLPHTAREAIVQAMASHSLVRNLRLPKM